MDDLFKIITLDDDALASAASGSMRWSSADEARHRLRQCFYYLLLHVCLARNGISHPKCREWVMGIGDLLRDGPDEAVLLASPSLIGPMIDMIKEGEKYVAPRRDRAAIAFDFARVFHSSTFSFARGLQVKWLRDRVECSSLIPDDLPAHGTVGIGHHAGTFVVQEMLLLRDAFALRQRVLQDSKMLSAKVFGLGLNEEEKQVFPRLSAGVCRDARTCVSTLHAFVECLVNSVAENFLRTTTGICRAQKDFLKGEKRGRYISFEKRLQDYPAIVSGTGKCPYCLTDPKQIPKDFQRFFGLVKPLRDSAAHHGTSKENIWRSPQEWETVVQEAGEIAVAVARAYWNACYPGRGGPEYLCDLDLTAIEERAKEDVKVEREASAMLHGTAHAHD